MNATQQVAVAALTHPGAHEINGVPHLRDAKGRLVPVDNIRPMDLLIDERVRLIALYAEDLSAELARFQSHAYADIAALDALIAQEFGIESLPGAKNAGNKGNRTFLSFDGLTMVKIAVSDRIVLGPELQAAKEVLDAIIRRRGEGADAFLVTLVKRAFAVDTEGRVDVQAILALRRMEVDDDAWPNFCRAIDASVRVIGSKRYLRIYRRETPDGSWQMIPLDIASVEPTPAAFARRTLRRQVEDLTAKIHLARNLLKLGRIYGEDGAMASMLAQMDEARELLGDADTDFTMPGKDQATMPAYVRAWLASVPSEVLTRSLGTFVADAIAGALAEAASLVGEGV